MIKLGSLSGFVTAVEWWLTDSWRFDVWDSKWSKNHHRGKEKYGPTTNSWCPSALWETHCTV